MWYVRFRVGPKRYNLSLGNDFLRASANAPKVMAEKRGINEKSYDERIAWHAYKGTFFNWGKPPRYKPDTFSRYQLAFKLFDEQFPHIVYLDEVKPKILELFQTNLLSQGYGNANINKLVGCIKAALRKAEEWEYIKPQSWAYVKKLPEPKGKTEWFTIEECAQIIRIAKGPYRTALLLFIRAGLRLSEMFYLPWEHVDLARARIHIKPVGDWVPKKRINRIIDIPADLVAHLMPMQRASGRVVEFPYEKPKELSHRFHDLIVKAGYTGFPHKFRHSYASHLLNNGASLSEVAKLLGHTTTRTTEIYEHILESNVKNAVSKLPKILVPA